MGNSSIQKAEAAHQPLFATAYLRSLWSSEYAEWRNSESAVAVLARLQNWASKDWQKETAAEGAFVEVFFRQTWGYTASGQVDTASGFTMQQQYAVKNAGQKGGTGEAYIALGYFGQPDVEPVPQVLGEFKDDRSGLDKEQSRSNRRSPVAQCFDYLREARSGLVSKVLPTWALVSDMNEFRLYLYGNKAQYQRFVIRPSIGDPAVSIIEDGEEASFQRFLFSRVFHADWLLASAGKSPLEKLLGEQLTHERALESDFYKEYQAYREHLFAALRDANPEYAEQGRLRHLVGFTQRLLDRFIFVLYCEDMGRELGFPPNVLRDVLIEVASSKFYREDGGQAWDQVRTLFITMRDGGLFGRDRIQKFNGGLFAADPDLDNLRVPNSVFCARNQGESVSRILAHPKTLLFLSAKYNFGATDDGEGKTLTLTAMGRIFEQSITDLEVMEARAAGRESLAEITKRKRDGVYYTPEWVTKYIVEQTVGLRLSEIRTELGFDKVGIVTDEQIAENRADGRKAPVVKVYEKALQAYSKSLDALKVVDPACGSGAFLIQAFQFLYDQRQWVAAELERVTGKRGLFDTHAAMRSVLADNLYGVDINAESIEITRLALWLHTALPDRPLTSLDRNIRCGNSLVSTDFLEQMGLAPDDMAEDTLECVNPFNWECAFPEVFERDNTGFDCVIGNPPYVKSQNFRVVLEDQAEYLINAKKSDGSPRYESTQTGSFDIYLPFIERGVELLNGDGKLGFIAPSVWLVSEYGKGLRRFVSRTQTLDRWIDFKSFQVFAEATTYTALQFFGSTKNKRPYFGVEFCPTGDLSAVDWSCADTQGYDLNPREAWVLAPAVEKRLIARLRSNCSPLLDVAKPFVGVQCNLDDVFILDGIGEGKYRSALDPKDVVEIEDGVMRPLIGNSDARRYVTPSPFQAILYPYRVTDSGVNLIESGQFQSQFPKAWAYLKRHEELLRKRERGRFDDEEWYRYGRNRNPGPEGKSKLAIPQTVLRLAATFDSSGRYLLNNVRVNGVPSESDSLGKFLLGLLNSRLLDFVFRRIAKPKRGGYFEANKQYLAPLPVACATDAEQVEIGGIAEKLQSLHTGRAALIMKVERRLTSPQCIEDNRTSDWIWADVRSPKALKGEALSELGKREQTRWAKDEHERRLEAHLNGLDIMLQPGATLTVDLVDDELKLLISGVAAIEGIFFSDTTEAEFVAAQWRHAIRGISVTEAFNGEQLRKKLLGLRWTDNPAIVKQVIELDREIGKLEADIEKAESEINSMIYRLYGLTEEEIRLVEAG